ncbi:MAG: class I SAM-dependent methyltransferase, partial [Calditrichia bacterium]
MKKKSENPQFQNAAEVFNQWAKSGRDKGMELGHQFAVLEALKKVEFKAEHAFLDIGCGNGWLVREVASRQKYSLGIGIDASREMVKKAREMTALDNIQFICTDILSWNTDFRFDTIVSMEAFYYVKPMEK